MFTGWASTGVWWENYVISHKLWRYSWLIEHDLRLHQHNIGYTADGFYRSDDPINSVKALKEGG